MKTQTPLAGVVHPSRTQQRGLAPPPSTFGRAKAHWENCAAAVRSGHLPVTSAVGHRHQRFPLPFSLCSPSGPALGVFQQNTGLFRRRAQLPQMRIMFRRQYPPRKVRRTLEHDFAIKPSHNRVPHFPVHLDERWIQTSLAILPCSTPPDPALQANSSIPESYRRAAGELPGSNQIAVGLNAQTSQMAGFQGIPANHSGHLKFSARTASVTVKAV
jgi:hypothetical protein